MGQVLVDDVLTGIGPVFLFLLVRVRWNTWGMANPRDKKPPWLFSGGGKGGGGGALVVLDPLALYLFEDAFKLIDTEELE